MFQFTPEGKERVLHSFCKLHGCPNGAWPEGLILDRKGNLYGTAENGGAGVDDCPDCGVVFKLTPAGKYSLLHTFCKQSSQCSGGANPSAPLVFDPKGNLYGTTWQGGIYSTSCAAQYTCGVIFKITP